MSKRRKKNPHAPAAADMPKKIRIGLSSVMKIETNDDGETITLNFNDQLFVQRTVDAMKRYWKRCTDIVALKDKLELEQGEGFDPAPVLDEMNQISSESARDIDGIFGENACMKIFGCPTPAFELVAELFDAITPFVKTGLDERTQRLASKYSARRTSNV